MLQVNYVSKKEIPEFNTVKGNEPSDIQAIVLYDDCSSISDRIVNKDVLEGMNNIYDDTAIHCDIVKLLEKISNLISFKDYNNAEKIKEEVGNIFISIIDIDINAYIDIMKFTYAVLQQQDTYMKYNYLEAIHELILEEGEAMSKTGDTETFAEHYGCIPTTEEDLNGPDVKEESTIAEEESNAANEE